MNTPALALALLGVAAIVVAGYGVRASAGAAADGPESVFSRLEQAVRTGDPKLFESQWLPEGYRENLVGGSGLAGSQVFEQAVRKRWFLKPDLDSARTVDGVTIVMADVWSWERNRAVDRLAVAIGSAGGRLVVLGAGEDRSQVEALAGRFARGEPLAPPK